MKRIALTLLCGFTCASAQAATIDALHVAHEGKRYRIELRARLDAPAGDTYTVFRNFDNLPRINDAVESVEPLPPGDAGLERWRTTVRVCVSFFCSRLHQVQDVRDAHDAHGWRLDANVIPELSNLRFGEAAWRLDRCAEQTCLWFRAELQPDFWVPPLIGPWVIERTMRRQAESTAQGIERLALEHRSAALKP